MTFLTTLWNSLAVNFENPEISAARILAVLLMVTVLALYTFSVYRFVLHRSLYNKAFNICIAVIPYFIATIILSLQSNMVITLGTIGALAILRFRTAVKDPVDMIFLLWAVHIGITCGCQLYGLAVMTSVAVTLVLLLLSQLNLHADSHVLVLHTSDLSRQKAIEHTVGRFCRRYRVKSRNITGNGVNFVYEVFPRDAAALTEAIAALDGIDRFSLMEYDPDDVL